MIVIIFILFDINAIYNSELIAYNFAWVPRYYTHYVTMYRCCLWDYIIQVILTKREAISINGNVDIGNKVVDREEEEEAGINWESSIETYTLLPYVK